VPEMNCDAYCAVVFILFITSPCSNVHIKVIISVEKPFKKKPKNNAHYQYKPIPKSYSKNALDVNRSDSNML
jgi:hypothetical protein